MRVYSVNAPNKDESSQDGELVFVGRPECCGFILRVDSGHEEVEDEV